MHEEKIALVDGQVKAVQQAVAARAVENVYFVACGLSLIHILVSGKAPRTAALSVLHHASRLMPRLPLCSRQSLVSMPLNA